VGVQQSSGVKILVQIKVVVARSEHNSFRAPFLLIGWDLELLGKSNFENQIPSVNCQRMIDGDFVAQGGEL